MFTSGPDRGPPTALRGWLSDVYFPTLLDLSSGAKAIAALASRLGAKATVDDPLRGRAGGLPAIESLLKNTAQWLVDHSASYTRVAFTTGTDRDVTEGTLSLAFESKTVDLPVAVVAERRRSREVELRIYFATLSLGDEVRKRAPLVAQPTDDTVLPDAVSDFVAGLSKGDAKAVLGAFEQEGGLRDAHGLLHGKKDGALLTFLDGLCAGGAFGGGLELQRVGAADDGRTCALEYTLTKARGSAVTPQPGLAMFERGDSGLLSAVRVYGDIEV
jgi:hypothetical protein